MSALPMFLWGGGLKPVHYRRRLGVAVDDGMPLPIQVGDRFGCLTVKRLSEYTDSRGNRYYWHCLCDCGKPCEPHANQLRANTARYCGPSCRLPRPRARDAKRRS